MTDVATATPPMIETGGGGRNSVGPQSAHEQSLLDLIHVCFGECWDDGPEPGRVRHCSRAELYCRCGGHGSPRSWGARLHNGATRQLECGPDSGPPLLEPKPGPHDLNGRGFRYG